MSNGISAVSDLDALSTAGRAKIYDGDKVRSAGLADADLTNLERVAVLLGDMLYQFHQNGVAGWVCNLCDVWFAHDLPLAVASAFSRHRDVDREMADFMVGTMAAVSAVVRPDGTDMREDEAEAAVAAWEDIYWRWTVSMGMNRRLVKAVLAVIDIWDPACNPMDAAPWPSASPEPGTPKEPAGQGVRYPDILVGFSRDGAGCRWRDENSSEGAVPDFLSIGGAVAWAFWRNGVPAAEITAFLAELNADRGEMALTVGRWVNADGNGLAGAEALREMLNPAHPWQGVLGISRERAVGTCFLFCASVEQATGLMAAVGSMTWVITYRPEAAGSKSTEETRRHASGRETAAGIAHCFGGPDRESVFRRHAFSAEDILQSAGNASRTGGCELVLDMTVPLDPEGAARVAERLCHLANCGFISAVVGADETFRSGLRRCAEEAGMPWDEVALSAIGKGPGFGGPTYN